MHAAGEASHGNAIEMQDCMAIQVEVQTTCYADERLLGKNLALSLEQGHEL